MTSTKINVHALNANFLCICLQTCKILKNTWVLGRVTKYTRVANKLAFSTYYITQNITSHKTVTCTRDIISNVSGVNTINRYFAPC